MSVSEQNTLKQIYIEVYGTVKGTLEYNRNASLIEKWLQQKRIEIEMDMGTPDVKEWYYACIDELLEDLE